MPSSFVRTKTTATNLFNVVLLAGSLLTASSFFSPVTDAAPGINPTVTPSASNVSTAGSITLGSITTTSALSSGSVINVAYNSAYTGTVSIANTTVNGAAPSAVSNSTSGGIVTSNLTLASSLSSGATFAIATSALTTPVAAGNYVFAVTLPNGQSGANFQYVGQANVVTVTAVVPTSLSFAIRNSADTSNTNTCNLSTQSTASVSSCAYRLKLGTNASNGATISVQTSGNFTNGSYDFANASVGTGGRGGTTIAAGTEGFWVIINKGSANGKSGTVSLASSYDAGATKAVSYVNAAAQTLLTYSGTNSPTSTDTTNTALVTTQSAIGTDTGAGAFTQTVTYTASPSY